MPPQLEKVARYIVIALIVVFTVVDLLILGGTILSDVFGLHFTW